MLPCPTQAVNLIEQGVRRDSRQQSDQKGNAGAGRIGRDLQDACTGWIADRAERMGSKMGLV